MTESTPSLRAEALIRADLAAVSEQRARKGQIIDLVEDVEPLLDEVARLRREADALRGELEAKLARVEHVARHKVRFRQSDGYSVVLVSDVLDALADRGHRCIAGSEHTAADHPKGRRPQEPELTEPERCPICHCTQDVCPGAERGISCEWMRWRELAEYAMHLHQYGERAPGGNETWAEFERRLRNLTAPEGEWQR